MYYTFVLIFFHEHPVQCIHDDEGTRGKRNVALEGMESALALWGLRKCRGGRRIIKHTHFAIPKTC